METTFADTSQPTASPINTTNPSTFSSSTTTTTTNNNATALLALLDQYIHLKGFTLTTNPPHPELTLPPLPTDHTPIALQMYPPTSLLTHLCAHETEQQELTSLSIRIATLSADPLVLAKAHTRLESEYTHLQRPSAEHETFKSLPLPQNLTHVRRQQSLATQPARKLEFRSMVVVGMSAAGLPDPMVGVYLPLSTTWEEYKRAMRDVMGSCSEEGEGEKGWVYQNIDKKGRAEREVRSLRGEGEYVDLRRVLRQGGGVLVWRVCSPLSSILFFSFQGRETSHG